MKYIAGKKVYQPKTERITVRDCPLNYECFSCDKCKILYEQDDLIVLKTSPVERLSYCPYCDRRIYGGSKSWYEAEYNLADEKAPSVGFKDKWRWLRRGNGIK